MAGSSELRLDIRRTMKRAPAPAFAGAPGGPSSRSAPAGGAPRRPLLGRLLGSGAEMVLAAAITFGFFGVFLIILAQVFPLGVSLGTIAAQLETRPVPAGEAAARAGAGANDGAAAAGAAFASLHVLRADVRSKPAAAIAWSTARDGQGLRDRDGVQTGNQGRAQLQFGRGNQVFLERNSLVIVSSGASEADASPADGAVVVLEGELWAHFASGASRPPRLAIGRATLVAAAGPQAAPEFRVRVGKDHAGTVSVVSGQLEFDSGAEHRRIGPRQFGRILPDGEIEPPQPLPADPEILGPADGASFQYRDLPPQIVFQWSSVAGADRYRLVVSHDRDARQVVVDEIATTTGLTWGRLKEGRYLWRVSALTGDAEGAPSAWRAVAVTREAEPPPLTVEPLPRSVDRSRIHLSGRVGRPAAVYVSGVKVATGPDGRFEFDLDLKPGANVIVVEAVDATGNTAYWSQIVNARF